MRDSLGGYVVGSTRFGDYNLGRMWSRRKAERRPSMVMSREGREVSLLSFEDLGFQVFLIGI